ncbi:MAG: hypothetical protein AAB725_01885 [Patescibacteria group bacterium]
MKNILIVEDEDFLMRVLQDSFVAEGYAVETAADGIEAMERIQKKETQFDSARSFNAQERRILCFGSG